MRPFEIVLVMVTALLMILALSRPYLSPKLFIIGALTLAAALMIHLIVEGYRWQMVPVYIAVISTIFLVIAALVTRRPLFAQPYARIGTALLGILLLCLGSLLSISLPITKLPRLTGRYDVGTTSLIFKDSTRAEIYTEDPLDSREIAYQIWYPIESGTGYEKSLYIHHLDIAGPALAARLDLPTFLLGHLELIQTNSSGNPPVFSEGGPYPLIIFSHGLMGIRMQNTFMMEELASHGYIVASPDHTYDSVFTVISNDRVIFHDSDTLFPKDANRLAAGQLLLEERQKDVSRIIDTLLATNFDSENMFFNSINKNAIGVAGHSTGGGTAIQTCLVDDRCKAVIALDSWVEPISTKNSSEYLKVPALFINTEDWLGPENQAMGQDLVAESQADVFKVVIEGTNHNNFTDIPLLSPLTPLIGLAGSINSRLAHDIINDYILAFLDRVLVSGNNSLSELEVEPYPQAQIEFHEP